MNSNRTSYMDMMFNKFKINSNRINRLLADLNDKEKIALDNYRFALTEYNGLYGAKIRDDFYTRQLRESQKRLEICNTELKNVQSQKKELQKYLKVAQQTETLNFTGYYVRGFVNENILNSLLDGNETYGEILPGFEYRPDKISAFYYNRNDLGWIIMLINKCEGVQDLVEGSIIMLPSLETMERIMI